MSVREPTRRAPAMGRGERRAAIIAATVPLLVDHGSLVTTRQIAAAAGVAEGTLFRVFADKDELLREALYSALDPFPTAEAIAAIPTDIPLPDALTRISQVLVERLLFVTRIFGTAHRVLGGHGLHGVVHPGAPGPDPRPDSDPGPAPGSQPPPAHGLLAGVVIHAITDQLDHHRAQLRLEPRRAARVLYCLILADCLPLPPIGDRLTIDEVVDAVLGGIARGAHCGPTVGDPDG